MHRGETDHFHPYDVSSGGGHGLNSASVVIWSQSICFQSEWLAGGSKTSTSVGATAGVVSGLWEQPGAAASVAPPSSAPSESIVVVVWWGGSGGG